MGITLNFIIMATIFQVLAGLTILALTGKYLIRLFFWLIAKPTISSLILVALTYFGVLNWGWGTTILIILGLYAWYLLKFKR